MAQSFLQPSSADYPLAQLSSGDLVSEILQKTINKNLLKNFPLATVSHAMRQSFHLSTAPRKGKDIPKVTLPELILLPWVLAIPALRERFVKMLSIKSTLTGEKLLIKMIEESYPARFFRPPGPLWEFFGRSMWLLPLTFAIWFYELEQIPCKKAQTGVMDHVFKLSTSFTAVGSHATTKNRAQAWRIPGVKAFPSISEQIPSSRKSAEIEPAAAEVKAADPTVEAAKELIDNLFDKISTLLAGSSFSSKDKGIITKILQARRLPLKKDLSDYPNLTLMGPIIECPPTFAGISKGVTVGVRNGEFVLQGQEWRKKSVDLLVLMRNLNGYEDSTSGKSQQLPLIAACDEGLRYKWERWPNQGPASLGRHFFSPIFGLALV
ncbi:hypothetical protein B0H16DRAFT_1476968 [Mycena metata]|uniref:Uncharacterized protein n=1 Tax=Mycena metata TaxID=1033252 RepID=A0AAD7HAT7_9AGAR|nr:hypothetical protein B0H16DRAFT_1476968 [Mycena metata]